MLDEQESAATTPEDLSPQERQREILTLRQRVLNREEVSSEELKRGLLLIRLDRQARTGRKPAAKQAKPQKVLTLADF